MGREGRSDSIAALLFWYDCVVHRRDSNGYVNSAVAAWVTSLIQQRLLFSLGRRYKLPNMITLCTSGLHSNGLHLMEMNELLQWQRHKEKQLDKLGTSSRWGTWV